MVIPAGTPELPRSDLVAPTWLVHCACRQNIRHVPPRPDDDLVRMAKNR